ncbi:hypothetical protein ACFVU2_19855 [Leifsonia sp. NPDC058194]|uniref:hypothetical protein n=1 Tax=Leifsonia sp. NPDC058194 TaxID=3346374 RepID=UPI0036D8664A
MSTIQAQAEIVQPHPGGSIVLDEIRAAETALQTLESTLESMSNDPTFPYPPTLPVGVGNHPMVTPATAPGDTGGADNGAVDNVDDMLPATTVRSLLAVRAGQLLGSDAEVITLLNILASQDRSSGQEPYAVLAFSNIASTPTVHSDADTATDGGTPPSFDGGTPSKPGGWLDGISIDVGVSCGGPNASANGSYGADGGSVTVKGTSGGPSGTVTVNLPGKGK